MDEPTIRLHPLDMRTLLGVFQTLLDKSATIIVIEHDLDVIANADYIIDLGPGGGINGGKILFSGTPQGLLKSNTSLTSEYLRPKGRES